jgi:predicted nucleic acid-binding protein
MSTAVGRLLAETTEMQQTPITDSDARASIRYILRHNLNATDALHLFVALRINDSVDEPVAMVSADSRLLRASKAEGLAILDPENSSPLTVRRLLQLPDENQS